MQLDLLRLLLKDFVQEAVGVKMLILEFAVGQPLAFAFALVCLRICLFVYLCSLLCPR